MKTIKVTDAAARFIKQLREEGIEERKVFLCDTYTKAVEQVLADIVGGRGRLFKLVGSGDIRAEKIPPNRQNGRWYCNAYDVIKWATIGKGSTHRSDENT